MNLTHIQSRLMTVLVKLVVVGLAISCLASTAHVVVALALAHLWPFALLLGLVTVIMNFVLIALTILNRRRNANRFVRVIFAVVMALLLSVEFGANLFVGAEYIASNQAADSPLVRLDPFIGSLWLSASFPLINFGAAWLLGEIVVQRLIEAEAVDEAGRVLNQNGRGEDARSLWGRK
jgi:hypothetical protein